MPKRRFRARLLSRLSSDLRSAAEVGLAFLVTAGVASCGGQTTTGTPGSKNDAASDGGVKCTPQTCAVEAAQIDGGVVEGISHLDGTFVEAAQIDGGVVEAASFEGGTVGKDGGTFVEAAQVDGGGATEGAVFVDGG